MGTQASAHLAYGYDLGHTLDSEYAPEEVFQLEWAAGGRNLMGDAARAIFTAAGKEYDSWMDDEVMMAECGIMFVYYGANSTGLGTTATGVILAAVAQTGDAGSAAAVDFAVPDDADERLDWALGILGITPSMSRPQWLLAASLG